VLSNIRDAGNTAMDKPCHRQGKPADPEHDDFRNSSNQQAETGFQPAPGGQDSLSLVSHGFSNNHIAIEMEDGGDWPNGFPNEFSQALLNI
jgi:hypothetical protein